MTAQDHPTESRVVNALIDAITRHRVRIEEFPPDDELEQLSLREVLLQLGDYSFRCLTDNEYGDIDQDNLPLKFSMVLMELEHYDGVDDFLEWARGHGMDAASPTVNALWDRLQENAVGIRQIVGNDLVAISTWDWSLDAGDARILRHLPAKLARPDLADHLPDPSAASQFDDDLADEILDWLDDHGTSETPVPYSQSVQGAWRLQRGCGADPHDFDA